MTEEEIKKLGFTREDGEFDFHYYVYEITMGLSFISNSNDEVSEKGWFIEFFNTGIPLRYWEYNEIKELIEKIESGIDKTLYYINPEGLRVFTEEYHKIRGYCCKNNCKHCPYKKQI
tara:strand:+ start:1587 stop:1937 length:351 start_codon:yes stop_codon:yes gene_type:complete